MSCSALQIFWRKGEPSCCSGRSKLYRLPSKYSDNCCRQFESRSDFSSFSNTISVGNGRFFDSKNNRDCTCCSLDLINNLPMGESGAAVCMSIKNILKNLDECLFDCLKYNFFEQE